MRYLFVLMMLLQWIMIPLSFAEERERVADEGKFYSKLILAPEWEFCSIYGRSLSGALIMPDVNLSDAEMIKIVKEIARDRKIRVNDKRILERKIRTGDSKCHFYAYLGSHATAPIRINTTVIGSVKKEQVVMSNGLYLYFENDKLIAYQMSE